MAKEQSRLWTTLSIEDDILKDVLKRLDPHSLQSIETTCSQFREFIRRNKIWKMVFHIRFPGFLESDYNKDILKRLKGTLIWDDHFKFKKLCLKLFKLEINWKSKNWKQKNLDLDFVFGQEVVKAVSPELLLSVSGNSFFSRLSTAFNLSTWKKQKNLQSASQMHVLSCSISEEHVLLFGEPRIEARGDQGGSCFWLELLYRPPLARVKRSADLGEHMASQHSQARLSGGWVVLFHSHHREAAATRDSRDAFHLYSWAGPGPLLEHVRTVVPLLPPGRFLRLASFGHELAAGVRRAGGQVKVWGLGAAGTAAAAWSRDLSNRGASPVTALALAPPLLAAGLGCGRCELWHLARDRRLARVGHGQGVARVLVLPTRLLTLTTGGVLQAWDLGGRLEWREGLEGATDVVGDGSRILCIRPDSLALLDLWPRPGEAREHREASVVAGTTGKRRKRWEEGKKKKCCAFC